MIVQGFLLYSIIRFGREPGDETDAVPVRGNTRLEIFWTVIPALVVVFIGLLSYQVLAEIEQPTADQLTVEVKAIQYAWQFYYPEQDITTTELHIPLDRQVHLKLRSNDVIHSFWVPEFRIKKDVMPDRVTETYITGTESGDVSHRLRRAVRRGPRSHALAGRGASPTPTSSPGWPARAWRRPRRRRPPRPIRWPRARRRSTSTAATPAMRWPSRARSGRSVPSWTASARAPAAPCRASRPRSTSGRPSSSRPHTWRRASPTSCRKDYEQRVTPADLDALVKYLLEQK